VFKLHSVSLKLHTVSLVVTGVVKPDTHEKQGRHGWQQRGVY